MGNNDLELQVVRKQFRKFGTEIDFQIVVADESQVTQAQEDLAQAEQQCDKIEKIFSRFDSESELMKINSQLGKSFQASVQLLRIAELALAYHEKTHGYFDPRIIGELEESGYGNDFDEIGSAKILEKKKSVDFGKQLEKDLIIKDRGVTFIEKMDFAGVVKGFTTDTIAEFFKGCGWKNFLVDCGGDMFFSGKDKNNNPWYVDIEGIPYQTLMLELEQNAIATSGIGKRKWEIDGKRFHHLIDPKNPEKYSFDLKSVTVVASHARDADVWAKTLFIMGGERAKSIAREKNIACAILDYRGGAWISTELKKYLYQNNEQKN